MNMLDKIKDTESSPLNQIKNTTGFVSDDILSDQRAVHNQEVIQADTACVVTVRASSLTELDVAYSHATRILGNNLIGYTPAESNMLEVYKSAQPWGGIIEETRVDCISPQIASLLPLKRMSSRTGNTGIWFGNQRMANPGDRGKEIMVDLSKLSAEHGIIVGPTGSGKTFLELVVFMMRAHDQGYIDEYGHRKHYRVIYLTTKSDDRTQYRSVPIYYGDDGAVIDVGTGEGKVAINPLHIVYDSVTVEKSADAALRIFHGHKANVLKFVDSYIIEGITNPQKNYLDRTLNEIYAKHGIITLTPDKITCHPEKWGDGANFPTFHELRILWEEEMNAGGLKRVYDSAMALHSGTGGLSKIGVDGYINTSETIDLSKDVIVIDLSGLKKYMQDAMSAYITGVISARFDTSADQKTMLIIDEGVSFTENPARLKFLLDTWMMGRSQMLTGVICFTQPTDMSKELAAMITTNSMWAFVLGKGMGDSVKYVKEFFGLSNSDVAALKSSSIGQGLLLLDGQHIPIDLAVTPQEMSVLKGTEEQHENHEQADAFIVPDMLSDLVLENGFCLDGWIENPSTKMMNNLDYEPHLVNRVIEAGKAKAWIKSDIIDVDKVTKKAKVLNQTLSHFSSVMMVAGHLQQKGFEDVKVSHFDGADVTARLGDKKFAFEYEHPRSHTQEQLLKKKVGLEADGYRCLFVCQSDYRKFVAKAVGEHNTYPRGGKLKAAIDEIVTEHLALEAQST